MADLNFADPASWDPFCQRVQRELVIPLGLENAVISVDRHQGKNRNVGVELTAHPEQDSAETAAHDDLDGPQLQLSMGELTSHVQSIAEALLEDCDVCFGGIQFFVKRGLLKKVVFSYSKWPQESTASFFLVNA